MTDLRQVLGDIDHALTEIRRELTPALHSMAGKAATGYATSTRPGAGGTPGHGDPVLATIAATHPKHRHATDPHPDRAKLDHALLEAARQLATARGIVHRHTPPAEAQPDDGIEPCRSCTRLTTDNAQPYFSPASRRGLCDNCYRWWLLPGNQLPPLAVVEAWMVGERVTPKVIARGNTLVHRNRHQADAGR